MEQSDCLAEDKNSGTFESSNRRALPVQFTLGGSYFIERVFDYPFDFDYLITFN